MSPESSEARRLRSRAEANVSCSNTCRTSASTLRSSAASSTAWADSETRRRRARLTARFTNDISNAERNESAGIAPPAISHCSRQNSAYAVAPTQSIARGANAGASHRGNIRSRSAHDASASGRTPRRTLSPATNRLSRKRNLSFISVIAACRARISSGRAAWRSHRASVCSPARVLTVQRNSNSDPLPKMSRSRAYGWARSRKRSPVSPVPAHLSWRRAIPRS